VAPGSSGGSWRAPAAPTTADGVATGPGSKDGPTSWLRARFRSSSSSGVTGMSTELEEATRLSSGGRGSVACECGGEQSASEPERPGESATQAGSRWPADSAGPGGEPHCSSGKRSSCWRSTGSAVGALASCACVRQGAGASAERVRRARSSCQRQLPRTTGTGGGRVPGAGGRCPSVAAQPLQVAARPHADTHVTGPRGPTPWRRWRVGSVGSTASGAAPRAPALCGSKSAAAQTDRAAGSRKRGRQRLVRGAAVTATGGGGWGRGGVCVRGPLSPGAPAAREAARDGGR